MTEQDAIQTTALQETSTAELNRSAFFADGTAFYRDYTKKEDGYEIRLRLRTAKGDPDYVDVVTDHCLEKMTLDFSDALFDYYIATLSWPACGDTYYFDIHKGETHAVYNKRGSMDGYQTYYNFHFKPELHLPDWAKGAIYYQIFTDRFYNGDASNDVLDQEYFYINGQSRRETDWDALPDKDDVAHFYGGDLQGILDKLDYLQELGVEVLYLNPIFVSPSNHKYDCQDYDYIDPHYGVIVKDEGELLAPGEKDNRKATRYISRVTDPENLEASNAFFIKFVEEVHARGMKVVLDGVFNHCGSFNKWMDREQIYEGREDYPDGAYVSEKSPYRSFFKFTREKWPYNKNYEGWWNHETLPKLNYEDSGKLYDYILKVARKWVSPPYNADGWRLDVAADLGHSREYNHYFWKAFRQAVKEANPEAIILAENYEDSGLWLDGDQWDTIMNYEAFMDPISWFLTGTEKHNYEFREDLLNNFVCFRDAMSHHMSRFHYDSLHTAMNELSNHDHSRFITRTSGQVGRLGTMTGAQAMDKVRPAVMREAVVMQMTWPGAPTVYYGDEAGVAGWTDPDNRRTYPWGHEDQDMLAFHKTIIGIHRGSWALRQGSFKLLCGEDGMLAYARFVYRDRFVIAVNNLEETRGMEIPVWLIGLTEADRAVQVLMTTPEGYTTQEKIHHIQGKNLTLTLPGNSAIIIRSEL